jgi:hypothetical protein
LRFSDLSRLDIHNLSEEVVLDQLSSKDLALGVAAYLLIQTILYGGQAVYTETGSRCLLNDS